MGILDAIHDAQLHRETYIAILKSVLRTPGSKRQLAAKISVSQQYISYLLNPQMDDSYAYRSPSLKIAEKIANALPLDSEQRQTLVTHMLLAREKKGQIMTTLHRELPTRPLDDFLKELRQAHHEATYALDPQEAKTLNLAVRDTCKALLKYSILYTYPLNVVEVCMFLHDVQCILNCPADALYHAKLAHAIMSSLNREDYRDKERFDGFQIQVIRAEIVAYNNLQLFQEAYNCCLQVEESEVAKRQIGSCLPHLYRDKIRALSGRPRFALSEVEGLATQVSRICDHQRDDFDPLWVFLINRFLGLAYLRHQNVKKAAKTLQKQFEQMDKIPHLGPLHRTMFLKVYARCRYEEGDSTEWEYLITQALQGASSAGLTHQIHEIQQEYGAEIQPFLVNLKY